MSAPGTTIPVKRSSRSPADAPRPTEHGERASGTAWVTLAVVAGGLFLAVLSTTVVSVALPRSAAPSRGRAAARFAPEATVPSGGMTTRVFVSNRGEANVNSPANKQQGDVQTLP
jgi:hypothetical protein